MIGRAPTLGACNPRQSPAQPERTLTVAEAAERLHVAADTVYHRFDLRRLARFVLGIGASRTLLLADYGTEKVVNKRFRDLPNIVWVLGGDFIPNEADWWTVTEVVDAIWDDDSIHLMSAHGSRGKQVVIGLGDPKWLTVNTAHTDARNFGRADAKRNMNATRFARSCSLRRSMRANTTSPLTKSAAKPIAFPSPCLTINSRRMTRRRTARTCRGVH